MYKVIMSNNIPETGTGIMKPNEIVANAKLMMADEYIKERTWLQIFMTPPVGILHGGHRDIKGYRESSLANIIAAARPLIVGSNLANGLSLSSRK